VCVCVDEEAAEAAKVRQAGLHMVMPGRPNCFLHNSVLTVPDCADSA